MNMKKLSIPLILAVVLLAVPHRANAVTMFTATVTGSQEVPPNPSTASGLATFVLNDAMTALTFSATIFGLDFAGSRTPNPLDNLIAAHIHAPAARHTRPPFANNAGEVVAPTGPSRPASL